MREERRGEVGKRGGGERWGRGERGGGGGRSSTKQNTSYLLYNPFTKQKTLLH